MEPGLEKFDRFAGEFQNDPVRIRDRNETGMLGILFRSTFDIFRF